MPNYIYNASSRCTRPRPSYNVSNTRVHLSWTLPECHMPVNHAWSSRSSQIYYDRRPCFVGNIIRRKEIVKRLLQVNRWIINCFLKSEEFWHRGHIIYNICNEKFFDDTISSFLYIEWCLESRRQWFSYLEKLHILRRFYGKSSNVETSR